MSLRYERSLLLGRAKSLLDKAEAASRNLTKAEERDFNELMGGVNYLARKISEEEGRQLMEAWNPDECRQAVADLSKSQGTIAAKAYQPGDEDGTRSADMWNANGREVRALRPDQRLYAGGDNLSLGRLLRGVVTGDWKGAEGERRAMSRATDTLGGFLLPEPLSARVIDLARAKTRVIEGGALTIEMESGTLRLARVTGDPTASWRGENQPIPVSDPTFGLLELNARTLGALVRTSVELIEDAINMPDLIENALAQALALELDRACLFGNGAVEPMGIRNWPGVQVIDLGPNGAKLTNYEKFSEAVQKITEKNGPTDGLAVLYAPRTAGTVDRFIDTTGQPLTPPESFNRLRRLPTNQIPVNLTKGTANNASLAVIGDFRQLLIGMRTQLTLEVSRQAADATGSAFRDLQIWIRGYLRADVVLARPEHFVVIDGIIP